VPRSGPGWTFWQLLRLNPRRFPLALPAPGRGASRWPCRPPAAALPAGPRLSLRDAAWELFGFRPSPALASLGLDLPVDHALVVPANGPRRSAVACVRGRGRVTHCTEVVLSRRGGALGRIWPLFRGLAGFLGVGWVCWGGFAVGGGWVYCFLSRREGDRRDAGS
jgi:hypothetical protein